jgi:hypothetical protein
MTQGDCQTVLVIVDSICSGRHLLDAVRLLEPDFRLEIVFAAAPEVSSIGVSRFLADIGVIVVPWRRVAELEFELVLSATFSVMDKVHAPVIVMPHGTGSHELGSRSDRVASDDLAYGSEPNYFVRARGRMPAAIVLPHHTDWERLARICPVAAPAATVVGDPHHDRLVASLPLRAFYRRALGVHPGQKLVVVTSARGPRSLFRAREDLVSLLLSELPREQYRVLGLCPPVMWSGCGVGQMCAGTADHLRRGLSLMPPNGDWRAALAAADCAIGDCGSAAVYGSVAGIPVLLTDTSTKGVDPSSAAAELSRVAPRLSRRPPVLVQLEKIMSAHDPDRYQDVVGRITSAPGSFNRNMRRLMYRLIGLPQPATIPMTDPVSPPFLCD